MQPRVRLFYSDEGVRDRFCANAQRLLQAALDDPLANSTDAQIALKALRYRKVLHRLDGLDPQDPGFDVSTFFGVEWCKDPVDSLLVVGRVLARKPQWPTAHWQWGHRDTASLRSLRWRRQQRPRGRLEYISEHSNPVRSLPSCEMIGSSTPVSNLCAMADSAASVADASEGFVALVRAASEAQRSLDKERMLKDASLPLTETSGDRGRNSASDGDREFFLDEFDTDNLFLSRGVELQARQDPSSSLYQPVAGMGTPTSVPMQTGVQSQGSEGSLLVRCSLSKKRPLPVARPKEDEREVEGHLSRGAFMRGSRSATQQAKGELALQIWWGAKFAAGRLHSMMRCIEPSVHPSSSDDDDQTPPQLTAAGRPCCSEPGCSNQVQMKGKCMRHGGVSQCKHPGCESAARWHGVCVGHGGRRVCSEENCSKLIRSAGKCEEHGGSGYKKCSHPGCTSKAQKRGLCVPHGGFTVCKTEGCDARASSKGLCRLHGGAKLCQVEGCEKVMSNRGYCYKHGVEKGVVKVHQKPKCKEDGCLKIQICRGFCSRHAQERGFTVGKTCKVEGCTRMSQSRGCCLSHGGGTRCKIPDCNRPIVTKGLCAAHGGRKTCLAEGCEKWGLSSGELKGYCVQHGGGTRCKHPGCNKSVQYKGLCCVHGGYLKCDAEGCDTNVRVKGYCILHERLEAKKSK